MALEAWTIESVCDAMVKAGFPKTVPVLQRGSAIVWAESAFIPTATNPSGIDLPASGAYGLWQIIYPLHSNLFSGHTWSDGNDNTAMAYELYKQSGWSPWAGDGSDKHMKAVMPAVQNYLKGDPGAVDPGLGLSLPNPLSGIETAFSDLTNLISKVFDPNLWKRIGIGLLGAIILLVGISILVRDDLKGPVSDAMAIGSKAVESGAVE